MARPGDGHLHGAVGRVVPGHGREGGRGEDAVRGVDVEVVLFRLDLEVADPLDQLVAGLGHADGVADAVAARMRDPLAAGDELPERVAPEGVAHAAVAARDAGAPRHRLGDVGGPLAGELGHGPDRDDEVEGAEALGVVEGVERVGHGDLHPLRFQHPPEESATRSGSWPAQPPQVMSAFMVPPFAGPFSAVPSMSLPGAQTPGVDLRDPGDGGLGRHLLALAGAARGQLHDAVLEAARADGDAPGQADQVHRRELLARPRVAVVVERVEAARLEAPVEPLAGGVGVGVALLEVDDARRGRASRPRAR